MEKGIIATVLIFVLNYNVYSEVNNTHRIDSMYGLLANTKADYNKVDLLLKISHEYSELAIPNFDSAMVYSNKAMSMAIKTGNKNLLLTANNSVKTTYRSKINNLIEIAKTAAFNEVVAKLKEENAEAKERIEAKSDEQMLQMLKQKQTEHEQTIIYFIFLILIIVLVSLVFLLTRLSIIKDQKGIIISQKKLVEERNKQIIESIEYAHRIQKSTLPSIESIKNNFKNSFVLFKPKDILSGDFYWFHTRDGESIIVCADCTGHGVPGAIISMVGCTLLNEIVRHKNVWDPAQIIVELSAGILTILGNKENDVIDMDGMDITICKLSGEKVIFAGVNNSLLIVNKNGVVEIKPQVNSIHGIFKIDTNVKFESIEITPENGSMIYMSTDGYADQIGEATQKKMYSSGFQKLLSEIYSLPLDEQKEKLESYFYKWKGNLNQRDDILVMGGRV